MPKYEVKVAYPDSDRVDLLLIHASNEEQARVKAVGGTKLEVVSVGPAQPSIDVVAKPEHPSYSGLYIVGVLMLVLCIVLAAVAMVMFIAGLARDRHEMGAWMTAAMGMGLNCLWLAGLGFFLLAFRDHVMLTREIRLDMADMRKARRSGDTPVD